VVATWVRVARNGTRRADISNSYSGEGILGMGVPFVIGMGFLLLGAILLALWRLGGNERLFDRKGLETVDPRVLTEPDEYECPGA